MERKGRAGDKRSGRDKEEPLWTTAATWSYNSELMEQLSHSNQASVLNVTSHGPGRALE